MGKKLENSRKRRRGKIEIIIIVIIIFVQENQIEFSKR